MKKDIKAVKDLAKHRLDAILKGEKLGDAPAQNMELLKFVYGIERSGKYSLRLLKEYALEMNKLIFENNKKHADSFIR